MTSSNNLFNCLVNDSELNNSQSINSHNAENESVLFERILDTHSTHYEILGLPNDSTHDVITKTYRQLARLFHPDVYKGDQPNKAELSFKKIAFSAEILRDEFSRRDYDQIIFGQPNRLFSNIHKYTHSTNTNTTSEQCDESPTQREVNPFEQSTLHFSILFLGDVKCEIGNKFTIETDQYNLLWNGNTNIMNVSIKSQKYSKLNYNLLVKYLTLSKSSFVIKQINTQNPTITYYYCHVCKKYATDYGTYSSHLSSIKHINKTRTARDENQFVSDIIWKMRIENFIHR